MKVEPNDKRKFEYLMDGCLNALAAKTEEKIQEGYQLSGSVVIQYKNGECIGFIQAVIYTEWHPAKISQQTPLK